MAGSLNARAVGNEGANSPGFDTLEASTVRRTVLRLIPLLMTCYFVAYLNRVNLSFASLQMNGDLHLSQSMYGLGAGLFFVTYCVFGIPSNLFLAKFGARRWMAGMMFAWGLCAVGMLFITGPLSFYAMRLLLGAAEAGFYPGVLYFMTLWYPLAHRGRILGLFIAAIPLSGIIGNPLSGALLSVSGLGMRGWQWLYLIEGAPAFLLAIAVFYWIQDGPSNARWLPVPERQWLMAKLDAERKTVESRKTYSVLQTLLSPRVFLLALVYFSNVCLLNAVAFFLPQIVRGFGLSTWHTGLVSGIPSVVALFVLFWWSRRSDSRKERYGHAALANLVGGLALLSAMLVHGATAQTIALSIAYACTLSFTAPFWAIPGSFLSGSAAAAGIAGIGAMGALGGFLAPWCIGVLRERTGNFHAGLELAGALAMAMSVLLYWAGRRQEA